MITQSFENPPEVLEEENENEKKPEQPGLLSEEALAEDFEIKEDLEDLPI